MTKPTINMKNVSPKELLINNLVPILFIVICCIGIPLSGYSGSYLLNEILSRLGRNSFLVLSLLIPVMAGMGLNFGCFDFIVTPSGEYVFLECNPNGQWLWVELETGLPISQAIAEFLIILNTNYYEKK